MLLFVDTNILLDFYRITSREGGLSILGKLERHHDRLITGDQVAMEFKKNRQSVILETFRTMRAPDMGGLTLPPVLAESKSAAALERHKKGIRQHSQHLKARLEKALRRPTVYDPVYKSLQRVFRERGPYNLSRDKPVRFDIRELAKNRFILGYPPRKQGDTSIGDAVNWEWLVRCAQNSQKGVVIATRDSDYGCSVDGKPVLNDWLREEWRGRVSRQRKIALVDRLTDGFKAAGIPVTRQEEAAEEFSRDPLPPSPRLRPDLGANIIKLLGYPLSASDDALSRFTPKPSDV